MLPSIVASELELSIRRFLQATFPITTDGFRDAAGHSMLDRFLAEPANLFRGPYVSLGLPFVKEDADTALPFTKLDLPFVPYRHQVKAFQRLCGETPRSTLVATGTGSGKTECFFLPILDYCLTHPGKGVKAIIVYPMNALATDQARRFAREVMGSAALKGKVTVGLYVGENDGKPQKVMTPQSVITCKDTLRSTPPDILLTNYKMLDFLLMRPRDQRLWQHNEAQTLRYLVVDELHTFDGAQGTDLACLVRRLRDRVAPDNTLACVGTSATIGGEAAVEALCDYAEQVFATPFKREAVILEERQPPKQFLANFSVQYTDWPTRTATRVTRPELHETELDYLRAQALLWFGQNAPALDAPEPEAALRARFALALQLKGHVAFRELLQTAHKVVELRYLIEAWQSRFQIPAERARLLLDSLLALVSAARLPILKDEQGPWEDENNWLRNKEGKLLSTPLVQVRVQLWLRELRRMVSSVCAEPQLRHADDLPDTTSPLHLPTVHCRACHATGWVSLRQPDSGELIADIQAIYQAWFANHPDVRVLFPVSNRIPREPAGLDALLCPEERILERWDGEPLETACADRQPGLRVWQPDMTKQVRTRDESVLNKSHHDCPWCGAHEGLSIMGARAASLSSVLIGRLYATAYNDNHKLIAFSDSVQDAAHRAGFFGARTYSMLVRSAIARYIHAQGEGFDVGLVAREAPAYWRKHMGTDEAFCGTFIAPNMTWLRDYEHLMQFGTLPKGSNLPQLVEKRLTWEVIQGFGLRARIGRTLERSLSAAVGVDRETLQQTAEGLALRMSEEIAAMRGVEPAKVMQFLLGALWTMRVRGAFYVPMLDEYIRTRGNTFQAFYRSQFMPQYGMQSPPPALMTLGKLGKGFDNLHAEGASWYRAWFTKVLATDAQVLATDEFRHVMRLLIDALARDGFLVEKQAGNESVWGLDPERWICSTKVTELACSCCGHRIQVPGEDASLWQTTPCLRQSCEGTYRREDSVSPEREFALGPPRRLVTAEHTALIDSETRHQVEQSFIHGQQAWDINLLSATPTLEMGIDIGDLSSVLLCSVPPTQANYLQRIGRAGRRDGNALAVTVANGHNHDLYFYADPLAMLAGDVQPPGVFLQATAVLERQLTAYCLDRWAASGVTEDAIPPRVQDLLDAVESHDQSRFPYTWLNFVDRNQDALLRDFLALFPSLPEQSAQHLKHFLSGYKEQAGISWRVLNRLNFGVEQRKVWKQRIDRLKKEKDELESRPQDEATREQLEGVSAERGALMALRRNTNGQATLNFFTDEGLLPNYAFPEEGVMLQSIILRRRSQAEREQEDDKGGAFERINFSLQRPAQAALGELAPLNRFYAIGREVEIDQIDLKLSQAEDWRLCDQCHYVENITKEGERYSVCPRCGSVQWADSAQKRTLLKLRQVYATAEDRDSRIGDDSDQRAPVFFMRQMLVDIAPDQAVKAYRIADEALPFAFEYVPRVTLREINFGQVGFSDSPIQVAGELGSRPGFQICKHCGKVRRKGGRQRRGFDHAYDCRLRRPDVQESDSDYFDSLYLFRELESEAIRILLPLSEVGGAKDRLQSLIAALNLGLRRYFKGNVDHLRVTHYSEPTPGGSRKQFLVLYDSIPGGSGYLKELLSAPEKLVSVFEQAYQVIARCACQDSEHLDGCYQCVLAYRDSRHMDIISRRTAMDLLEKILTSATELVAIDTISQVDINTLIESELEQRFISALSNAGMGITTSKQTFKGKAGLFVSFSGEAPDTQPLAWQVEFQGMLGPSQGVALSSKPDFILWPARENSGLLPVAVFMDGFAYHYNKVDDDTAKRQAILDSGKFYVWNLTWHDLPGHDSKLKHPSESLFSHGQQETMVKLFSGVSSRAGWETYAAYTKEFKKAPFFWLLDYLAGGTQRLATMRSAVLSRCLAWLDQRSAGNHALVEAIDKSIQQWAPSHVQEQHANSEHQPKVFGGLNKGLNEPFDLSHIFVSLPIDSLQKAALGQASSLAEGLRIHLAFDDRDAQLGNKDYEIAWQRFLGAANLLQLIPGFSMATAMGVQKGLYQEPPIESDGPVAPTLTSDDEWHDVVEYSLFGDDVLILHEAGLPVPHTGWDFTNADGEVVDQLELAWPERKVAILYDENSDLQAALSEANWQVLVGLDDMSITKLAQWLTR